MKIDKEILEQLDDILEQVGMINSNLSEEQNIRCANSSYLETISTENLAVLWWCSALNDEGSAELIMRLLKEKYPDFEFLKEEVERNELG